MSRPFSNLSREYGAVLDRRSAALKDLKTTAKTVVCSIWLEVVRDSATEKPAPPRKYVISRPSDGVVGWVIWGDADKSLGRYILRQPEFDRRRQIALRGLFEEAMR